MLKQIIRDKVATIKKLLASGTILPSYILPIAIPILVEINVCIDDIVDDAVPAIWPSGFIASALKLPNKMPKQKNTIPRYASAE